MGMPASQPCKAEGCRVPCMAEFWNQMAQAGQVAQAHLMHSRPAASIGHASDIEYIRACKLL